MRSRRRRSPSDQDSSDVGRERRFSIATGAAPPPGAVASDLASVRLHGDADDAERGAPGMGFGE